MAMLTAKVATIMTNATVSRCALTLLLVLGGLTSTHAEPWQQQAEACVIRLQDEEQRLALEQRTDFQAEKARADHWNELIYEQLPKIIGESKHLHDQLLLRWLIWADETRSADIESNPMAATAVDHTRSTLIMDSLARSNSPDPLVLAATMIACPVPGEDIQPGDYCGAELDRRFQVADPGNAYPWLQTAQRAWAAGNIDLAFELLAKTAETDHMDWYFGASQLAVAERIRFHLGGRETLDADELSLMAQTLGPQVVGYPGFLALSQLCSAETVAGNNSRIKACVAAVEALSGPGASLMDVKVATGVARAVAPSLVSTPQKGLEEWAQLSNRSVQELQAQVAGIGCLALEEGPDAYQSLYGERYLADVVKQGEFEAQKSLVARFVASQSE